jgi:hypothetical protein
MSSQFLLSFFSVYLLLFVVILRLGVFSFSLFPMLFLQMLDGKIHKMELIPADKRAETFDHLSQQVAQHELSRDRTGSLSAFVATAASTSSVSETRDPATHYPFHRFAAAQKVAAAAVAGAAIVGATAAATGSPVAIEVTRAPLYTPGPAHAVAGAAAGPRATVAVRQRFDVVSLDDDSNF